MYYLTISPASAEALLLFENELVTALHQQYAAELKRMVGIQHNIAVRTKSGSSVGKRLVSDRRINLYSFPLLNHLFACRLHSDSSASMAAPFLLSGQRLD